jgi:hypothetical protein
MTREQLTRLVHEDPEFARLVAASKNEQPPSDQFEKTLSLADEIAAKSRSTSWLGTNLVIGLAVLGAVTVGVVAGAQALRSGHTSASPVVVPAVPAEQPAPVMGEEAAPVLTVSVDDLAAVPLSAVSVATRRPATKAAAPVASAPVQQAESTPSRPEASGTARTTFVEELALVGAARSSLEKGDIPSCMRAVGQYQARFGSGTFAHEIEVIRIEALFASGERARAREAAEQFLAAQPKSPYADRVGSLLGRSSH